MLVLAYFVYCMPRCLTAVEVGVHPSSPSHCASVLDEEHCSGALVLHQHLTTPTRLIKQVCARNWRRVGVIKHNMYLVRREFGPSYEKMQQWKNAAEVA